MKANILLLSCHDLGDHLASYPGNSARTPHLARLAAEGMLFEQHFSAAPTCSPSRGAMLTGLMPHRNGLMALASGGHWEVNPDISTLPQLLQDAGYPTACFGTWHISAEFWDRGIEVQVEKDGDDDGRRFRFRKGHLAPLPGRSFRVLGDYGSTVLAEVLPSESDAAIKQ